jgi:RHS repeat-associated protein
MQKSGASVTNYVYEGANAIEEVDASENLLAKYSQGAGIDEPLSELRSGAVSYYEQDGLGSVTSLSGSGGALANTYTYDSFGNLTSASGTIANPYQYTGRDYDPETGLRYYRARYYDAAVGRFISEDPIRFDGGGPNFYRYVDNDPIDANDPDGQRVRICCRRLIGLMGVLTRRKHCYVLIEPEDGRPPLRVGLHKNVTLNGVFHPGGAVFPNFDGDDRGVGPDAVKNPDKDCTDINGITPCQENNMYNNYQNAPCRACGSNYKLLNLNSNTFTSDFINFFAPGIKVPNIPKTPGLNH